jgi:NAD(P)-dependent dehydrogenase (short-subunit alcohol dehydrogenase family)
VRPTEYMSTAYVQGVSVEVSQMYQYVLTIHTGTSSQMTSEVLRDEETQEHIISLHPFRGLGIPDDIARAAVFLASEDSSWITGVRLLCQKVENVLTSSQVALPVDGGYTAR